MHGLSLGPETFKRPARFQAGASFCCVARCSEAVEPGVGSVLGHSPSPSAGPCPPGPQCGPAASGLGPGAQDRHLPSLPYHARRPAPQPSARRRRRRVRSLRLATRVGGGHPRVVGGRAGPAPAASTREAPWDSGCRGPASVPLTPPLCGRGLRRGVTSPPQQTRQLRVHPGRPSLGSGVTVPRPVAVPSVLMPPA